MNLTERFRGHVVDQALDLNSFSADWPARRTFLKSQLGAPTPRKLVGLGSSLSEAFRLITGGGRTQTSLTSGGAAWQGLVLYYLNMIYAGTPAVAVTAKSSPPSIKSAMKVSYQGTPVLGDLDIALLVLPSATDQGEPSATTDARRRTAARIAFWAYFDAHFSEAYVALVAMKTNWNDSVQTPMLWNLLYSLRRDKLALPAGLAIGDAGFSLDQLGGFAFSFVTVPTDKQDKFKNNSMPVQRSRAFTGGYFWGYPPKSGVISNISSFPDRHASNSPIVPSAASCGVRFSAELNSPTGAIDLAAFQW